MSEGQRRHTINWGQAFAEVMLIVVGVGLALAADNWADERRELAEEQQYLVRLQADFIATQESLRSALGQIRHNLNVKLELIGVLQTDADTVSDEELTRLIRESFAAQMPTVSLATYSDMINSGDLRLLRNTKLRMKLAEFESSWADYQKVVREAFDQWNQVHVPFLIRNSEVLAVFSDGYFGIDLPGADISIDRSAIQTEEFINVLAISVISRQDMLFYGEQLLTLADEIVLLIDE